MERPAKRQKLSQGLDSSIPTKMLDSASPHHAQNRKRNPARVVSPRAPDVTVTAGVLEVAVNDGSTTTQIAVPTTEVAISIGSLGTLTVPASGNSTSTQRSSSTSSITATSSGSTSTLAMTSSSPQSSGSQSLSQSQFQPQSLSQAYSQNGTSSQTQSQSRSQTQTQTGTQSQIQSQSQAQSQSSRSSSSQPSDLSASTSTLIPTTEHTVTVTATSTFHVSYNNGTFVVPTSTWQSTPTESITDSRSISNSIEENTTNSESSTSLYVFGQGVTDTSTGGATATRTTATGATGTGTGTGTTAVGAVYGNNNGGIAATATQFQSSPTSSDSTNNNTAGPVLTPEQTQMVGGIVGGVAGIALVLVVLLYVLRWYRQRLKQMGRLPQQLTSRHSQDFHDSGLIGGAAPMSQSSRVPFFPPPVVSSSLKKWRPSSDMTMLTNTTSTTDSEKGFHRVSGRKIPSVLSTGGDQFGGSYGAFEKEIRPVSRPLPLSTKHRHDLSESSFYRDTDGLYIGGGDPASRSTPSTPVYPSMFTHEKLRRPSLVNLAATDRRDFAGDDLQTAFGRNMSKAEGVVVFRSSPARTPVTESPNTSSIRLPIQAPVTMDDDIPEMPLPSPGMHNYGYGAGLGHNLTSPKVPSRFRAGSTGSGSTKFTEDLR